MVNPFDNLTVKTGMLSPFACRLPIIELHGANFVTHRIRQDADILTARLNYRFPWPLIKY